MNEFQRKLPNALQHGVYSATTLLPGESQAAFEKWHRSLVRELAPSGPLEKQVVCDIARFSWRKQRLYMVRIAESAQSKRAAIWNAHRPRDREVIPMSYTISPSADDFERARQEADRITRKEIGQLADLAMVGVPATFAGLTAELKIEDILDAKIDGAIRRLLQIRGIKDYANRRKVG